MLEACDAAQGRGLAAARGPEQHHDLAGRHGKAYAVDRRAADRELLAQVGDVERRRHDLNIFMVRRSLPVAENLVPLGNPGAVQLHIFVELRKPDFYGLRVETLRVELFLERGEVAQLP